MNRYLARVLIGSTAAAIAAVSIPVSSASALPTLAFLLPGGARCASTTSAGAEVYPLDSYASFSADGTKVAFGAAATPTGVEQIWVKNLISGALTLVSTPGSGISGNDTSARPRLSPDGTKVAFYSFASNLVAGDTNAVDDTFVANLSTGVISRISTSATGVQADVVTNPVDEPSFSGDGNLVAFTSSASTLVAGDTNGVGDIFVRNLTTGAISRVSTSATGAQSDNSSRRPVISPDGTKVTFYGPATNLVAGDTNAVDDIFVKTLATGAIVRVTAANGVQPNLGSGRADFSPDGTKLAFWSDATNLLTTADTNATTDVFVKNLTTGAVTLVSSDATGAQANGTGSFNQTDAWSADGQKVYFGSDATNLVPGVLGGGFIKDLVSGKVAAAGTMYGTRISRQAARVLSFGPQPTLDAACVNSEALMVQELSVAPSAPTSVTWRALTGNLQFGSQVSWIAPASTGSTPVVRYEYCSFVGTTSSTCATASNWVQTTGTSFGIPVCATKCLRTSRTTLVRAVNFFATGPTAQVTYTA